MTLYKNKYRIESARCQNWNYTSNGYYFVTICTQNRQYFFGDVVAGKMELSPIGQIVAEEWQKTAQMRSYIELDEWVIMPNHLHGIIIIKNEPPSEQTTFPPPVRNTSDQNACDQNASEQTFPPPVETFRWNVSERNISDQNAPEQNVSEQTFNRQNEQTFNRQFQHKTFQRNVSTKSRLKPKSLGSIIGQIKTVCSKRIWKNGFDDFEWQERFYDHIIRDDESLHNIREYIINNPLKWELDKNNPANLYM